MKLSIIAEGGVMRGAYVVGVLNALHSHFGLKKVDVVSGSSASTGTLAYYSAGQRKEFDVWVNEIPKKRFMGIGNILSGRPFLDIDYLIDEIFKKKNPLNTMKLKNSKIKIIIPLVNADTGKIEYFSNKSSHNFFEIIRAAMSVPVIYGKNIILGKNNYYDGYFLDPLPIDHKDLISTRKIIILTKEKSSILLRLIRRAGAVFFLLKGKIGMAKSLNISNKMYRKRLAQIKELEKEGDIIIFPSKKLAKFNNSKKAIMLSIRTGYLDAVSNAKIKKLIDSMKQQKKYRSYFE